MAAGAERQRHAALLQAGLTLPSDRVPRPRRALARPDEDAITLAIEAAAAIPPATRAEIGTLIFASVTPPYAEGGNVQPIKEVLGLSDSVFAFELTATARDGLAALRLGIDLVHASGRPVLVCAANKSAPDSHAGDAGVALLLGEGEGLAQLSARPGRIEELRDSWRLDGEEEWHDADRSFAEPLGGVRLARLLAEQAEGARVLVGAAPARAAEKAEKELGGPGDPVAASLGHTGAAHPPLRLLAGLDADSLLVAVAGGMADALHVTPGDGAAALREEVLERLQAGEEIERPLRQPPSDQFHPYASLPRAWRERGNDLRLEDVLGAGGDPFAAAGTVIACTKDYVYPANRTTETAVVDLDGGARFYGQVALGEHAAVGDRVELRPRRLHEGGGMIQYFWKVRPCR